MEEKTIAPVSSAKRLRYLDMLRGFALFGVLLSNIEFWFRAPKTHEWLSVLTWPGFGDQITWWLLKAVIEGKFIFTFSLLFGIGLGIQRDKLNENSKKGVAFFIRRMIVLLLIGLLHVFLVWNGDILVPYAVIGLIMIFFFNMKSKTLFRIVIILWTLLICLMLIQPVTRMFGEPYKELTKETIILNDEANIEFINRLADGYGSSSWSEVTKFRVSDYGRVLLGSLGGFLFVFINILSGIAFWKSGVVKRIADYLPLLKRIAFIGLPIGLGLQGIYASKHFLYNWMRTIPWEFGRFVNPVIEFSMVTGIIISGYGFVAIALILYFNKKCNRVLKYLEPVGKMSLTNYLIQSIVMTAIFYGWGMGYYNNMGPLSGAAIGILFFCFQIALSKWWFNRYNYGPVEWIWRNLSYAKIQPFLLKKQNIY